MSKKLEFKSLDELIDNYKNKAIKQRQLIYYIKKQFGAAVINKTSFLDEYNPDILERLYYIINNLNYIVKCKYCDNKAIWSGRFNEGYLEICNSTTCRSKQLSDVHAKKSEISAKRDSQFILDQSCIKDVNDDIIINLIKYDKYLDLIDNQIVLDYLDTRYSDSYSRLETLQRIRMHVEEKPTCPICGSPVKFIGRKRVMFSTYCCDKCSANSKLTVSKRKSTLLEKWGSENCYDSEQYKQQMKEKFGVEYHWQREDIKEKREKTLMEHFGTTNLYAVSEIYEKIIKTNNEKFGCDSPFQSEEIRQKMYESMQKNSTMQSSKSEDLIYSFFLELGYTDIERFKRCDRFRYNVDFYIMQYDLFIEYQGSQFHNKRAFLNSDVDKKEINALKEKSEELKEKRQTNNKTQYDAIINTWSVFDVKKRNDAKNNNINYLEIFSCKSAESLKRQIDFYLACKNHISLYQYNNEELIDEFNHYKNLNIDNLSCLINLSYKILNQFQSQNFYYKEMQLYAEDPIIRRQIIQYNVNYLNKDEENLSPDDILINFKNIGICTKNSYINPCIANWFVHYFGIKTVYNPYGGFGEYILGMLSCEKIIYNDCSESIVNGVKNMKNYFNISQLDIYSTDKFIPDGVDAFFMCLPNENCYNIFIDTFDMWLNNSAKVFGLLIKNELEQYINKTPNEIYDIDTNKLYIFKK